MDAAPEPDPYTLYTNALKAVRRIVEGLQCLLVEVDEAVQELREAHDAAYGEAEGEAGTDADEADEEAYAAAHPEGFLTEDNGLEGCGVCTQFTPCPNPGIGCFVNPPAPDPCTDCDDSDDEFCGYHSEGGLPLTHGGSYPCPGIDNCTDPECPCD